MICPVERCHLVGADDQVFGMEGGKCPGFSAGTGV